MNNNLITAGVDEAGRGPVIGPMVIACVVLDAEIASRFEALGVKDSKLVPQKKRSDLYNIILDESLFVSTYVAWPHLIDEYVTNKSLNVLESDVIANIIDSIPLNCSVIVDSPSGPELFKKNIQKELKINTSFDIKCCFKADRDYICVGAASIVAKVLRDDIIESLKPDFGDFGSGYPSDPKTKKYLLKQNINTEIVRKTWKTYSQLNLQI